MDKWITEQQLSPAKTREEEFVWEQESQLCIYLPICLFIHYHLTSVMEFMVCVKMQ